MAEEVFVVEIDARDDGDQGRKNVGGIEAAAESDFEHSKLNAVAGEGFKCDCCNTCEIGGMRAQFAGEKQFFDQRLNTRKGFCKRCIADFLAVNADALVDFFEVWRSIQASAQTSVAKDGFEERDRKSTRLNSSHVSISYAVFCLKKKKKKRYHNQTRTIKRD